jgi:DnaJ homolog subfamily C member 7
VRCVICGVCVCVCVCASRCSWLAVAVLRLCFSLISSFCVYIAASACVSVVSRPLRVYNWELFDRHAREALKFDPDHRASKNLFKRVKGMLRARDSARSAKENRRWSDCLADAARAIELASDEEQYLRELYELQSEAALNGREYAAAVTAASWLIAKDPAHNQAYMWRARANMALEEYARAKQDFQQVMNRERGNREATAGYREAEQKAKEVKRKDYYKTLGVSKDVPSAQIRKAYRKLAVLHHPDKQKGEEAKKEAEAKFREINEAYEVLNDEGWWRWLEW